MISKQSEIDSKTEIFLKFILDNYKTFDEFITNIKKYHIKEELLYDNILENNIDYDNYFESLSEVINKYFYNPYEFDINKELLLEVNKLINNEYNFRDKNIIHRHFLHEVSDYKEIDKEVDNIFNKFNNNDYTTLENYCFLIYNLYQIYPFLNALALRFIGNIYLLKNDYLPLFLSTRFKSEYYYIFQYDFNRFKESFFELILKNLDFLAENLGLSK